LTIIEAVVMVDSDVTIVCHLTIDRQTVKLAEIPGAECAIWCVCGVKIRRDLKFGWECDPDS